MNAPKEVIDLAEQRIQARANKDFALSDQLRDKISDLGYVIKDNPSGYELVVKPPFEVFQNLASVKIKADRLNKKVTIRLATPMVNIPCAMMSGNPTDFANDSSKWILL